MAIDLHKKAERAGICLKKQGIGNPPHVRVGLMMDISGSMRHLYQDGVVQEAINHVLGLAMNFDPTHHLDVWVFDHKHAQLPVAATPRNFHDYVNRQILTEDAIPKWGTTCYAGAMHQLQDHYFGRHADHAAHLDGREEGHHGLLSRLFHRHGQGDDAEGRDGVRNFDAEARKLPVLAVMITDGDNEDHAAAERAIRRSAPYPVFWSLVGIGDHAFRFLKQMDREFDDAEFVDLEDLRITDDALYAELVSPKLASWLKQHPPRA
ncbi:VWA domain-containing protein [Acidisoma cellulosilytica]|uniref:VWA domain-containing protein n=1 Tax=Acidisoma cellulosilyticum TaxID=2802395 RepID=A0A963Z5J6_9PROT|nr:VWA domain-containing protein [Acidisoma cellulosilyticum]MCB8882282.1 VWA domain-containing protein [Acidisoma cellulosilyticum]